MGMSNFQFQESQAYADCVPGVWESGITDMKMSDDRKYIEIFVGASDKAAEWNRVPFKKRIYDGDSFDRQWSAFCECFGFTAQNAPSPTGDYRVFVGKRGRIKYCFEKRELVDGKWTNVPSDYMQITFISPKSKLATGPLQSVTAPQANTQAKAQAQGFNMPPAPDSTPAASPLTSSGGFPADL